MNQAWQRIKQSHPGVLLGIRLGDFYEFYNEDAETVSRVLEVTLTGRRDTENGRIPMAGLPYHSIEKYLTRLIQEGCRVALIDDLKASEAKWSDTLCWEALP